jgi:RNA polymerase sigma-70 factor (ECF subfamily)
MDQQETNKLISRSKQNDLEAFRKLVGMHQGLVYSLAFRLLNNEDDARDAVQETFIRVWKHLQRFNEGMRFSTWLYKIATNICYDRLKAIKRQNSYLLFDIENARLLNQPSMENIEADYINSELAETIIYLTKELAPKQKLVFTLRDLEGLEVDEIVTITGLSPAKIKSNLYCARQFIREKLEKI